MKEGLSKQLAEYYTEAQQWRVPFISTLGWLWFSAGQSWLQLLWPPIVIILTALFYPNWHPGWDDKLHCCSINEP